MKNRDFAELADRLLPHLPGFAAKAPLMFLCPVGHILRGFCFDSSRFGKSAFHLQAFFMPLSVPYKHIHFTFGERIGRRPWSIDDPNLEIALAKEAQERVPFLAGLHTAKDIARALGPLTKPNASGYVNPHCLEALAYSLVRAGDTRGAFRVLAQLQQTIDPDVPWQQEVAERAAILEAKLLGNPADAEAQLAVWEAETIQNLGLEGFL